MRSFLFATALVLAAPALAEDDHSHHLSDLDGFRAVHAWTRATSGGEAMVFVELENRRDSDVLVEGAESDIAAAAALVAFDLKDGVPSYSVLPPLPVPAGREMHFEPDALAIRLTGLTRRLAEGEAFDMHLETSLGEIALHVEVEAATAQHHSHAGHSH